MEISTAYNIKSKHTRNAVIDALKNLVSYLNINIRGDKIPQNGLVMLSGAITDNQLEYYV